MLQTLSIRNIALIDKLDIEFSDGFQVLTGETGAGKSIIIDSVSFLMGERASRELLMTGADKGSVQGIFSISEALKPRLDEAGIDYDAEEGLIVSREINAAGKSTARINGVIVTLNTLKTITDLLVDIHGQHEHQSLLHPEQHIGYLDAFGHAKIAPIKQEVRLLYDRLQPLYHEKSKQFLSDDDRLRRIDVLRYQLEEIGTAQLQETEEAALKDEYKKLSNAQAILSALENSYALLLNEDGGALLHANEAMRQLEGIRSLDAAYADVYERLQASYYALEDVGYTLRALKSDFEFQPDRLQAIEARLDVIHTLQRKYGDTFKDIRAFYDKAVLELETLTNHEERQKAILEEIKKLETAYDIAAEKLTFARKQAAKALSRELITQFKELGMEKAVFDVSISESGAIGPNGHDAVEFLLSTNTGEPVKPLHRIASGGELSRIMLAFKCIYISNISTVIFDEIDQGISGQVANVVGKKMAKIAQTHQVLAVTHLAQIAAMADVHFNVQKVEKDHRTYSKVKRLTYDERVLELVNIMGATEDDRGAVEHAKAMIGK